MQRRPPPPRAERTERQRQKEGEEKIKKTESVASPFCLGAFKMKSGAVGETPEPLGDEGGVKWVGEEARGEEVGEVGV